MFHHSLADKVLYDIVRVAYKLSEMIMESEDDNSMVRAACCAARRLLRLRRLLSRRQVCMVFQTLYYSLTIFVLSDGSGELVLAHNPLHGPDDESFLASVLDGIARLLSEYDINWYESLEIVELQAAVTNLIKQNIMTLKLVVQAVELLIMTVRKLLSPELALLIESQRGGSVREVAAAAHALITCKVQELRLAGLRLLLSFIDVAYVKFVPFRAVMSEKELVLSAARCALSEPEPRVQAAALRCLAAAARLENLWRELHAHHNSLYEQLVRIMRDNPEGEVCQEAASVLTHVHINHKVTDAFTSRVSRAMVRAATRDRHGPVQVAALNYWKQYIKTQFTDRGMIDGTFPFVTFCKEKRKIIVLNNYREVMDKAYQLTSSIVNVLDNYTYNCIPSAKVSSQASIVNVTDAGMTNSCDFVKHEQRDLISEIFDCLSPGNWGEDSSSQAEVIHPGTFVETYREMAKKWSLGLGKVDLGSLIDEVVSFWY